MGSLKHRALPCIRTLGLWEQHVLGVTAFIRQRNGVRRGGKKIASCTGLGSNLTSKWWLTKTVYSWTCWIFLNIRLVSLSCSVAGHSLVTAFLLLLSFIFYWLMLSCILWFFGTLVIVLIFPLVGLNATLVFAVTVQDVLSPQSWSAQRCRAGVSRKSRRYRTLTPYL